MGFNITPGGMGVAFQGARAGQNDVLQRERDLEDRDFAMGQRKRGLEAQAREDQLRSDLSTVTPAGADVPVPKNPDVAQILHDDTTGPDEDTPAATTLPVTKKRTQDQELRDISAAYRKAGDIATSLKLNDQADRIAFGRATAQFNSIVAGSDGLSSAELARRIGKIYDADPTSGGIKSIEEVPGGVRITIHDKNSGATDTREFIGDKGRAQLLDEFRAYYAPDSWNRMQEQMSAARAKAMEKAMEEAAKSHVVANGGAVVRPDNTVVRNGAPDDGTGTGSGSGTKGKAPKTRLEQASDVLASIAEKSEDKLTTDQRAVAEDYLARLVQENNDLPPAMAARVALKIAKDPKAVQPGVNPRTGKFDGVVVDDITGEQFSMQRDIGDAQHPPASLSREDLAARTADMTTRLDRLLPGSAAMYTAAAFDPSGAARTKLEVYTKDQIRKQMAAVPGFAQLPQDRQEAAIGRAMEIEAGAIQNRLDMILNYGARPRAEVAKKPGGLFGGAGDAALAPEAGRASYDELMRAKSDRDALMAAVEKMSPERREGYLATRLPDIEARIKANQGYLGR